MNSNYTFIDTNLFLYQDPTKLLINYIKGIKLFFIWKIYHQSKIC